MIEQLDWRAIENDLNAHGCAVTPPLLDAATCEKLQASYADDAQFRSTVVMARHGFGRGEYRYFSYPLPGTVSDLRTKLYAGLAPIANRWEEMRGRTPRFPAEHAEFLATCHAAG